MTSSARDVRLVGPAAAVGMSRSAAMGLSLASVTLTYYALTPANFTFFNLLMFLVGLGSAISTPLNRAFWASNSSSRFSPAALSSAVVSALTIFVGVMSTAPISVSWAKFTICLAAILYSTGRIVERFGYGRLLTGGSGAGSIAPILYFAAADLSVAAMMWATSLDSLAVRLAAPAVLFLMALTASPARRLLSELKPTREATRAAINFGREHIISPTAIRVITVGAVATVAGAGDRLLANYLPLRWPSFEAAYLLVVSYGIALQTLSAFFFDMARTHVFHDDRWQPEAVQFSIVSTGAIIGLTLVAWFSYEPLIALKVLPRSIELLLWGGILARSCGVTLAYMYTVDRYQQGSFRSLIMADAFIAVGGTTGFALLYLGFGQEAAGAVVILTAVAVGSVLGLNFARRIGR